MSNLPPALDPKTIILEEAEKIAKILKVPVELVLKDLAKGKESKLIRFLGPQ